MTRIRYMMGGNLACPSQRFRVLPYLERLRDEGFDAAWQRLPQVTPSRAAAIVRLRGVDVVVLHRVLLRDWQLRLLRRCVPCVAFDMDDALHHEEGARPGYRSRIRARLRSVARWADRIVVGNGYLASELGSARGEVLVLPTPVDTARFCPARRANRVPVLVWTGTGGNLPYLAAIAPALRDLARRRAFELRVVSDRPFALDGIPIDNRAWSPEREVADLATADINLMPLADNAWTRGKCGYKLLLGMSCGLASVASPVGMNREILAGGSAGFLAADQRKWREALEKLIADPALRERVGQAARDRVVEQFSLDRCYPVLRDFLVGPTGRRRERSPALAEAARHG